MHAFTRDSRDRPGRAVVESTEKLYPWILEFGHGLFYETMDEIRKNKVLSE
jgi:hypothetical protein